MKNLFVVMVLAILVLAFTQPSKTTECAKLQKSYDSLIWVNKAQAFRIERVKFYVKICQRNPTQKKFLLGWVNRSVN
jgi:hypothetical protein